MQVARYEIFHDGGSGRIETSPLICWTGFCIIGTSVMKVQDTSSSTYTESLFLNVVKHNFLFLFFFFFFLPGFTFTNIHDSQDNRWRKSLFPYILSTTSTHFTITYILAGLLLERGQFCAQLAVGIEHGTFGTRSLGFTYSTLTLVAAVVRRMLIARVTLGNISRVLSNLIKRLVFAMFKDSSSLPMFTQLTVISVWLVSWYIYSVGLSLFTGHLRTALAFLILTTTPFYFRIPTR